MNRPDCADYVMSKYLNMKSLHHAYRNAMEEYCDFLEEEIERLKGNSTKDCNGCFGASINDCEECPKETKKGVWNEHL